MARVVQYTEFGGPEVLHVAEVPVPEAAADGVVVEVKAIGVNPYDWKARKGVRESAPITKPRRLGSDAAGVIVSVGDEVSDWAVGDNVIVRSAPGAYATHLAVPITKLVRKPDALSWEQAAAIGVPVGTAYQVLRSLDVHDGDILLVHGAAGGVGQAAIQFATAWGATVIGTASRENHTRLAELEAIPVSYGPGLADRVREAAPGGIDVALDAAGTDEAIQTSLELVADHSRIGTIVQGARAAELGIRAWSGGSPIPLTPEEQQDRIDAVAIVADLAERGRFDIEIAATYPLDDVVEAHRLSEGGHVRGKIVLVP